MFRRRIGSQAGLTLLELIVVSGVLMMLTMVVYATFRTDTHHWSRETAVENTQSTLRVWLGRMVRDVRRACFDPAETGLFTIQAHAASDVRFTLDADADGVLDTAAAENVGYRLVDGELQLWQGGASWRTLLDGVTQLEFTYLDAHGDVTTDCESIAMVEIVLSAEASTGGAPGVLPPILTQKATAEVRNDVRC